LNRHYPCAGSSKDCAATPVIATLLYSICDGHSYSRPRASSEGHKELIESLPTRRCLPQEEKDLLQRLWKERSTLQHWLHINVRTVYENNRSFQAPSQALTSDVPKSIGSLPKKAGICIKQTFELNTIRSIPLEPIQLESAPEQPSSRN